MLDFIATQMPPIAEDDVGNEIQQINTNDSTQYIGANKTSSMMDTLRSKIVSMMSVQRLYTFRALYC